MDSRICYLAHAPTKNQSKISFICILALFFPCHFLLSKGFISFFRIFPVKCRCPSLIHYSHPRVCHVVPVVHDDCISELEKKTYLYK